MRYRIKGEVYGGITGHRVNYLKGTDNAVLIFDNREDAEKKLPKSYTTERGVTFRYWIEEAA